MERLDDSGAVLVFLLVKWTNSCKESSFFFQCWATNPAVVWRPEKQSLSWVRKDLGSYYFSLSKWKRFSQRKIFSLETTYGFWFKKKTEKEAEMSWKKNELMKKTCWRERELMDCRCARFMSRNVNKTNVYARTRQCVWTHPCLSFR